MRSAWTQEQKRIIEYLVLDRGHTVRQACQRMGYSEVLYGYQVVREAREARKG